MSEIIALCSRKGGTGKTTSCWAIAGGIRKAGKRVLLIDLDSQKNLTGVMGADPNKLNATDLLDGSAKPARTIQHTEQGDIIAGSGDLAAADVILTANTHLKKALTPLLPEYDFILIDCPASYGRLTMNALTAATSAIITLEPAAFSEQGIEDLADIIKQIRRTNKKLNVRGILITRCDKRSNEVKQAIEDIRAAAAAIGTEVLEPPIRATAKVGAAQRNKINLLDYQPRNNTAASDYNEIIKELLKE